MVHERSSVHAAPNMSAQNNAETNKIFDIETEYAGRLKHAVACVQCVVTNGAAQNYFRSDAITSGSMS